MKRGIISIIAVVVLLGVVLLANADIVVLNFESISTPGTGYTRIGPSYTEDGFKLEAVPNEVHPDIHRSEGISFPWLTDGIFRSCRWSAGDTVMHR